MGCALYRFVGTMVREKERERREHVKRRTKRKRVEEEGNVCVRNCLNLLKQPLMLRIQRVPCYTLLHVELFRPFVTVVAPNRSANECIGRLRSPQKASLRRHCQRSTTTSNETNDDNCVQYVQCSQDPSLPSLFATSLAFARDMSVTQSHMLMTSQRADRMQ